MIALMTASALVLSSVGAAPKPANGSAIAIDAARGHLWLVDEEREEVVRLELARPRAAPLRIATGRWPEQLVIDSRGRAFVSCRQDGRVDVIEDGAVTRRIDVGPEPRALALDEEAGALYVGLVTERAIAVVDLADLKTSSRIRLPEQPMQLALTPKRLVVLPRRGGEVWWVDRTDPAGPMVRVPLTPEDGSAWHGYALAARGDDVIVFHSAVDTGLSRPVSTGGYGGNVTQPVRTVASLLREGELVRGPAGFAARRRLPGVDVTGAAWVDDVLAVSVRGSMQVHVFRVAADASLSELVSEEVGAGLTGVAIGPDKHLWTFSAFERIVRRYKAPPPRPAPSATKWRLSRSRRVRAPMPQPLTKVAAVSLGPGALEEERDLGRRLFHIATNSQLSASTLSCATCHPDGREDGLVWRLQGTRRQTPMLADRLHGTAPFNWEGDAATLEANVAQTIERLGGTGLPKKEVRALTRYITEGLRAPTRPSPPDAKLVALGREVFHRREVACDSCHVPDRAFTDGNQHDVESTSSTELREMRAAARAARPRSFDTPSLRYLALTAPYLHDGSSATVDELVAHNGDKMGDTRSLSPREREALVAYLESL